MKVWETVSITEKGLALQNKLIAGEALKFTKVNTGASTVLEEELPTQTEVADFRQDAVIQRIKTSGEDVLMPVLLTNTSLMEGYTLHQVGIYAEDPDEGEILYCLAQTNEGKIIPAKDENPGFTITWDFHFKNLNNFEYHADINTSGLINIRTFQEHTDNTEVHVSQEEKNTYLDKYPRTEMDSKLSAMFADFEKQIINKMMPVGFLYYTYNANDNPNNHLPGKWQRTAQGRVIAGVNEAEAEFSYVKRSGGEKVHTLTASEMPKHDHYAKTTGGGNHTHTVNNVHFYDGAVAKGSNYARWNRSGNQTTTWGSVSSVPDHTHPIKPDGGSQAHNNLQPYITAYIWERIS